MAKSLSLVSFQNDAIVISREAALLFSQKTLSAIFEDLKAYTPEKRTRTPRRADPMLDGTPVEATLGDAGVGSVGSEE